jgi:type II secretory pathway pseudopilin PulG
MPFGSRHARASRSHFQRGQAMLLVVMLIGIVTALLVYGMVDTTSLAAQRDKVTAAALAQAKQALIGRAFADSNRPGSLPCPDTDNDGSAESPIPTDCPGWVPGSNVYVGRLPWRTLGLPDLRDGSGERLWYAVTREFATNPTNPWCAPTCPLNTDNKGQLTITGIAAATNVIAIVFSAGSVVATQVRDTANQNNVANYLEGGNEIGITTSTFVYGISTDTFNDRLLAIASADIWPQIEKRAASEILAKLAAYRSAGGNWCTCYPWADLSDGVTNEGRYNGRVPLLGAATPSTPDWGALGITIPSWLKDNNWWYVFFYTVSANQSASHGAGTLTVDGVAGTSVVLIATGTSVAGDGRPVPGAWVDANWSFYVDDPENSDLGVVFITPTPHIPAYAQDRLYKL